MARGHRRLSLADEDGIWSRLRAGHAAKPTARALGLSTGTVRAFGDGLASRPTRGGLALRVVWAGLGLGHGGGGAGRSSWDRRISWSWLVRCRLRCCERCKTDSTTSASLQVGPTR